MSRENSPSSNRRQEYLAEYWQDVTVVVSNEEVVLQHPQGFETTNKKKKKKSRGNRKLQRFRAKLRNQGLDNEVIASMINPENNPINPQRVTTTNAPTTATTQATAVIPKRKRGTISKIEIPTSVSEISLLQPSTKRTRSALTTADLPVNMVTPPKKKSNYLHLTDLAFKNLLSTTLKGIDEENLLTLLNTPEKIQYIRVYTQLINDLFYLKLKDDFWKSYEEVVLSSSEIDFNHRMSKSFHKEHHLHRLQFVKRENILKRQQIIDQQSKQIEQQLFEHKHQTITGSSIDIHRRLSTIIPAFIRQRQQKLAADFQYKKQLLQFDVNDHRLVQTFYHLKPSTDQIHSTKMIWQATMDQQQHEEHLAILKQRIYVKRLPTSFDLLDHSIDPNTEQLLRNPFLPMEKRTVLSSQREKIISRFKYDLLTLNIRAIEESIRSYGNMIANEKKKLTDTAHGQVPLPKFLVDLLHAITARQSNIIKRAQLITKQKLHFFDQAPTVTEKEIEQQQQVTGDNTTVGATIIV